MNEMENTIILVDEEGTEMRFEMLDVIAYEGAEYAVLVAEEGEETDTVVIVKVEADENGEESFVSVDDESILDAVFAIFVENNSDEFDFVD